MIKKLRVTVNGQSYDVSVEVLGTDASVHSVAQAVAPRSMAAAVAAPVAVAPVAPKQVSTSTNNVTSPLAGKVVSVDCKIGDSIAAGQKVLTLEAMKMNTEVTAHAAGTVTSIAVHAGDSVEEGQVLVVLG